MRLLPSEKLIGNNRQMKRWDPAMLREVRCLINDTEGWIFIWNRNRLDTRRAGVTGQATRRPGVGQVGKPACAGKSFLGPADGTIAKNYKS